MTNSHNELLMARLTFSELTFFSAETMPFKLSSVYAFPFNSDTTGIGSPFGIAMEMSPIKPCDELKFIIENLKNRQCSSNFTFSTSIFNWKLESLSVDWNLMSFCTVNLGVFPKRQSHEANVSRSSIKPGNHFSVGLISWKPRCFWIKSWPSSFNSTACVRRYS